MVLVVHPCGYHSGKDLLLADLGGYGSVNDSIDQWAWWVLASVGRRSRRMFRVQQRVDTEIGSIAYEMSLV
jgi:hypothetical protein